MKISCTQENLNQGLFVVSHVASKNSALPILNNVLIQAQENSIKLSATNLEIGVTCIIRGKVEQEGDFTVQSRLLADYISLLPKDRVDLQTTSVGDGGELLEIHCKNYSTKINGQQSSDFPVIPQVPKKNLYIIDAQQLRQALTQVLFAVSVSETRPEINGVLFNFNHQTLVLAATDSYRLAEKTIHLDKKSSGNDQQVIVPTKTLQELQRILGSVKDPADISQVKNIELYVAENQILFVIDGIELTSRLIEGQYPDYRQIIPTHTNTQVAITVSDLLNATKTSSLFARSGIYDVNIVCNKAQQETIVSAANNQLGENVSHVSCEVTGDDNAIVVNYRYMLDGLQNVGTPGATIGIIDSSSPCVIQPTTDKPDYLYIIMPIKK